MRYTIRRITLRSVARLGCLLGWLIALVPALCSAGVIVRALRAVDSTLTEIRPVTLSVLGQEVATIDLLALLNLQDTAQTVDRLVRNLPATFLLLSLLLMLVGALLVVIVGLLFGMGYNLLATMGTGLTVELEEEQ